MTDVELSRGGGMTKRMGTPALAVVIIVVTLIAYLSAIRGGFIWDDNDYLVDNTLLRSGEGLIQLWIPGQTRQYYPGVFTSFWVEYHLWGLDPLGYHITNVALHILSALLVWRLFSVLGVRGAWMIGAVFALHPVHVESVAWITERKNVLSGFFYLLAALAYLRFDRQVFENRSGRAGGGWVWYAAALVLFALALLSKTVTCTLPAALILGMLLQRRTIFVARLAPLAPMFALGLVLALQTAHLEQVNVGALGRDFDFSFPDRLLIASQALLFYPSKLLWPWPLMFFYPRWTLDTGSIVAYWPVLIVAAVAVAALLAYRRGRRGPAIALAFYAGTIFPALGFFNIYPMRYSFVADHFQYLASLGIIALVVSTACLLLRTRSAAWVGAVLVLSTLGVLTFRQGPKYHDSETLWRQTIAGNPEAWMPRSNLAAILLEQADLQRQAGDLDAASTAVAQARQQVEQAIAIKGDTYRAHAILSEVLRLQGDYDGAIQEIGTAIRLASAVASNHWRRGRLYETIQRFDEATAAYRQAVERAPDSIMFRLELARVLDRQGWYVEAAEHYARIIRLDPENVVARAALADIGQPGAGPGETAEVPLPANLERLDEAIVELVEQAAALVASDPASGANWLRLGMIYHTHTYYDLARQCYARVLDLDPISARALYYQALCDQRLGDTTAAIDAMQRVTVYDSAYAPAWWRLGLWQLEGGDLEAAEHSARRATDRNPDDPGAALVLARVLLQKGEHHEASRLLERLVEAHPGDRYGHFLLGTAYRQQGRIKEASRELALGRDSSPRWPDPWVEQLHRLFTGFVANRKRAIALSQRGDVDEAIQILEDLRTRRPTDASLIGELAVAYRKAERVDEAIELLREALVIQPGFDMAHFHLAAAYRQKYESQSDADARLLEQAMEHADTVLQLSPTFAAGHAIKADILMSLGHNDLAVDSLRHAIRYDPGNPLWPLRAGALLLEVRQWEDAIPLLESAAALDPSSLQALMALSSAHLNLGRLEDARSVMQTAARIAPLNAGIQQALQQIEEAIRSRSQDRPKPSPPPDPEDE